LKNDEKVGVTFEAIVSVSCFELWLLLHFVEILAPIDRAAALTRLKQYFPGYEKGNRGTYAATSAHLELATERATALKKRFSRLPGTDPYTDVHELVAALKNLRNLKHS